MAVFPPLTSRRSSTSSTFFSPLHSTPLLQGGFVTVVYRLLFPSLDQYLSLSFTVYYERNQKITIARINGLQATQKATGILFHVFVTTAFSAMSHLKCAINGSSPIRGVTRLDCTLLLISPFHRDAANHARLGLAGVQGLQDRPWCIGVRQLIPAPGRWGRPS